MNYVILQKIVAFIVQVILVKNLFIRNYNYLSLKVGAGFTTSHAGGKQVNFFMKFEIHPCITQSLHIAQYILKKIKFVPLINEKGKFFSKLFTIHNFLRILKIIAI